MAVEAALGVALVSGFFAIPALAVTASDPALLLAYLNRMLCASTAPACTGTAIVARYEPDRRVLTWAQAGHPAPLLRSAADNISRSNITLAPLLSALTRKSVT